MLNNASLTAATSNAKAARDAETARGDLSNFDGYDDFNKAYTNFFTKDDPGEGDWSSAKQLLGGGINRMRASYAVQPNNLAIVSALVNAEKRLVKGIIDQEFQPSLWEELTTLGFASNPSERAFSNKL